MALTGRCDSKTIDLEHIICVSIGRCTLKTSEE